MLRLFIFMIGCMLFSSFPVLADENKTIKETHLHVEDGVVYCDVQTFRQESYILKVLASGSPITVYWQFNVLQKRDYWFKTSIALVRLGRQVIPDLVTKRWLMRDLSSGIGHYTADVRIAMRFLTEMNHAAIVDISVLDKDAAYVLKTTLHMYEGERDGTGWWSSLLDWGEDMGLVNIVVPSMGGAVE